jgi:hypothetical protein
MSFISYFFLVNDSLAIRDKIRAIGTCKPNCTPDKLAYLRVTNADTQYFAPDLLAVIYQFHGTGGNCHQTQMQRVLGYPPQMHYISLQQLSPVQNDKFFCSSFHAIHGTSSFIHEAGNPQVRSLLIPIIEKRKTVIVLCLPLLQGKILQNKIRRAMRSMPDEPIVSGGTTIMIMTAPSC